MEHELNLEWAAFQQLPQVSDISYFHRVTGWSQLDIDSSGVLAQHLLILAVPLESAKYIILHGIDGYTTNIDLNALLDDDVIVAHSVLVKPLTREHGRPVRMVIPKRYAWKSAKWLKSIELHAEDRPGFWEVCGYHNCAHPWLEQGLSVH